MAPNAVADGYFAASDRYDGIHVRVRQGQERHNGDSTRPRVRKGTSVLIRGTVLDQSPAQPGTPCVSEASMATQMEYLHMQAPDRRPRLTMFTMTGVPVTLTAIDSNGNRNPHRHGHDQRVLRYFRDWHGHRQQRAPTRS